jgi:hypothetical protein
LLTLTSRFVKDKDMQHKNVFEILSLGDVFSKSYGAGQPKNFYLKVVFSEKSGKMYNFPSTTFVAFWRVKKTLSYTPTANDSTGCLERGWGNILKLF